MKDENDILSELSIQITVNERVHEIAGRAETVVKAGGLDKLKVIELADLLIQLRAVEALTDQATWPDGPWEHPYIDAIDTVKAEMRGRE